MAGYRGSGTGTTLAQPSEAPTGYRRLSKAPTNTAFLASPSASSSKLDLISPTSSRPSPSSSRSEPTIQSCIRQSKSWRGSRQKLRDHTFDTEQGATNEDEEVEEDDGEEDGGKFTLVDTARGVRERINRTSTIVKRASVRMSLGPFRAASYSSQEKLSSDEGSPQETCSVIDQIRVKAFNDSLLAINHSSSAVDGDISLPSMHAPVRRRSLFTTPGLATRDPKDPFRRPPMPAPLQLAGQTDDERDREHYFNPALSVSSPLGWLASLDTATRDRLSPVPRSSTPADRDYGHIGAGMALRITNGMASPGPSIHSTAISTRQISSESRYTQLYFTATEDPHSDEDDEDDDDDDDDYDEKSLPSLILGRPRKITDDHGNLNETPKKPDLTLGSITDRSRPIPRRKSDDGKTLITLAAGRPRNLSDDYRKFLAISSKSGPSFGPIAGRSRPIPRRRTRLNNVQRNESSDSEDEPRSVNSSSGKSASSISKRGPDCTSKIAQGYMADLAVSPYDSTGNIHKPLPQLPTTKANEFEDELFEDSDVQSVTSPMSLREWRDFLRDDSEEPASTSNLKEEVISSISEVVTSQTTVVTQSVTTTTTGNFVEVKVMEPVVAQYSSSSGESFVEVKEATEPVLLKADSGYSSITSLRSMQQQQPTQPSEEITPRAVMSEEEICLSPETFTNSPFNAVSDSKAPSIASSTEELLVWVAKPHVKVTAYAPNGSYMRAHSVTPKQTAAPTSGAHITTENSSLSMQTLSSTVRVGTTTPILTPAKSGPKKLQKKPRPKSLPPPSNRISIQSVRDVSGNHVPPVPTDLTFRHAERSRGFPPLEHTLPSLHHSRTTEDICNTGPISPPLRFPSPAQRCDPEPKRSLFSVRKSNPAPDGIDPRFFPERQQPAAPTTKAERRASRQKAYEDAEQYADIADFGDVTAALGRGPYDAAKRPSLEPSSWKRSSSVHPHQMTNAGPRSSKKKATIGMAEVEAADLARLRSQYRNMNPEEELSPRLKTRHSYHFAPPTHSPPPVPSHFSPTSPNFNDRGGVPGKWPRRISTTFNAPPVPAIPVAKQARDFESRGNSNEQVGEMGGTAGNKHLSTKESLHPDWQIHSKVWAERRKSAGVGLRTRDQVHGDGSKAGAQAAPQRPSIAPIVSSNPISSSSANTLPTPSQRRSMRPFRAAATATFDPFDPEPKMLPPAPGPNVLNSNGLRPPPPPHRSSSSSSLSAHTVPVQEGTVARLSGRFENGLAFGYERGRGVGGSAGTRGMGPGMGASRKSVEVSSKWGVDLSDVPVFVAPAGQMV